MNKVLKIQPEAAGFLSACELARLTAAKFGVVDFDKALAEHLRTGYVVSLPTVFLMARLVEAPDGRAAWFITHAIGNLGTLAGLMPFYAPWIVFRRRLDQRWRWYRTDRLIKHASRRKP